MLPAENNDSEKFTIDCLANEFDIDGPVDMLHLN